MNKKFQFSSILSFLCIFASAGDVAALHRIKSEKDPAIRAELLDRMQQLANRTSKDEFDTFDYNPKLKTNNPLLKFYDETLDRVKQDVINTQVSPGNVAVWYLYNMGFIIKTPTACFGVDIHHRRAVELAEVLDFVAITHNHLDHQSIPLLREMNRLNKPIISNFFENRFYTKEIEHTHRIADVTICCGEADHHSKKLAKFTMPLEIICPTGNRNFVFFTSGDCSDEIYLHRKSEQIDLYAVHPFCGMKAVQAAKKLTPRMTFLVHLLEMSHEVDRWRWTVENGRSEQKIFDQEKLNSYIPVWGEKFIWNRETLSSCKE